MKQKQLDPSTEHPDFAELARKYDMCEDAFDGDVLEYIPHLTGQSNKEYEAYVSRAAYFNVVDKTVAALIGAMTRKPYTLNNVVDFPFIESSNPTTFIQELLRDMFIGSRISMLVDTTILDDGSSKSQIINYDADDVINWGPNFYVIKECSLRPDPINRFELVEKEAYRELYLDENGFYSSKTWTLNTVSNKWQSIDNPQFLVNGAPITFIPLYVANPIDNTMEVYNPPLFTQASLNIQWFKQAIDLAHYAHFMAIPTPTITGELKSWMEGESIVYSTIKLGSTSEPTQLSMGSTFEYVEVSGASFKMLQDEMKNTEERMASAGSRLLSMKNGVESVEALQIRSGSESAVLESMTNSLEAALSGALQLCAIIDKNMSADVSIQLNKDFTAQQLEPTVVKSIMDLYTAGIITLDQALQALYAGEVVQDPANPAQT